MPFAEPRLVTDSDECIWYHTMDLPGLGTVNGQWDLRTTIDDYLGRVDFRDRRCLDVGTASGYLTWMMEQRGASEVVSMDLESADLRDLVPFAGIDLSVSREVGRRNFPRIQASYWLAHRLLRSRARVWYGTAYDLPAELGQFDVVVVGMMLPHTERPLRVLEQVARRAEDTIVVTQQAPGMDEAFAYWMPNIRHPDGFAWWSLSETALTRMLEVVGFEVVNRVRAGHLRSLDGLREPCTATVAVRRVPLGGTR